MTSRYDNEKYREWENEMMTPEDREELEIEIVNIQALAAEQRAEEADDRRGIITLDNNYVTPNTNTRT
jgi:hypothetical protein